MKTKIALCFISILTCANLYLFANESDPFSTLDGYLYQNGFALSPEHSVKNEGYSSEAQRKIFLDDCQSMPNLKKVLEIGFNGGHSCEAFLSSRNDITVISFDCNVHPYTRIGVEYMSQKYPGRFQLIPGGSTSRV